MILVNTDQTIKISLGNAVTTAEWQWMTAFVDIGVTTFVPGNARGVLAGTVDVAIVPAPAPGIQRQTKFIFITNTDTVQNEVTIRLDVAGVGTHIFRNMLESGQTLSWAAETGWTKGAVAAESFIDLRDTPGTYSGAAGKVPQVTATEDALQFTDFPAAPVQSVFSRTGTVTAAPGDYDAGQISETATAKIMTDAERTKLAGITLSSGTWSPAITGLTTPGTLTYSLQAGQWFRMNSLVFATFSITVSGVTTAPQGVLAVSGITITPAVGFDTPVASYNSFNLGAGFTSMGIRTNADGLFRFLKSGNAVSFNFVTDADVISFSGIIVNGIAIFTV